MSTADLPKGAVDLASVGQVARRAMLGAAALLARQVVVKVLNLAGSVVLARQLTPAEFGYYGITIFLIAFLGSFGDVGLGASLIRQQAEPQERDYRAVFTFQQILVAALAAVFCLLAPWLSRHYQVAGSQRFIFYAVAASLVITSFCSIPAIRLERRLAFDRLVIVDAVQSLSFNAVAVYLALTGHGVYSFAVALLVRSVLGAVVIQMVGRWRMGWSFDWASIRTHFAFGIPYQTISIVSLIKDSITPFLVGTLVNATAVGYITWAQAVAAYPVLALMMLTRVYLPAFARLQHDRAALGRFVERVIWATNAICAPLAILMLALFEPFTRIVFGEKWLAAQPYFWLLWVSNLFVPTVTPLFGLISALGRARTGLIFAVTWMVGTWLIGAPAVVMLGGIGFAVANVCVQFTNFALVGVAKRLVDVNIMRTIWRGWAVAAAIGAGAWAAQRWLPIRTAPVLITYSAIGMLLYLAAMSAFDREAIQKLRLLMRSDA